MSLHYLLEQNDRPFSLDAHTTVFRTDRAFLDPSDVGIDSQDDHRLDTVVRCFRGAWIRVAAAFFEYL